MTFSLFPTQHTQKTAAARASLVLTLGSAILLTLAACTTMEPVRVLGDPVQRYQGEGIQMRLEFLDEDYLRARYGRRDNTFIAPPGLVAERFMTFELEVYTEKAVRIDVNRVELQIGASTAGAQNQFQFGQYWRILHDTDGRSENDSLRREREIEQTLLPNRLTLSPGQTDGGLLVFRGRFPRYGTARVYVPVLDGGGREVERGVFEFEF